jgi:hypothetical protein
MIPWGSEGFMEERELFASLEPSQDRKDAYEPPEATVVPVELEARVGGCNFSTISVCGLTE